MRVHLTVLGKKGIKCSGLKKILPVSTWTKKMVPYFRDGAELPDLTSYRIKSPIGKRKRKPVGTMLRKSGSVGAICRGNIKKRMIRDGLFSNGKCIYSKAELLAMLHMQCDNDERWVLKKMVEDGAATIRKRLSTPTQDEQAQLSPREALELKMFTGISQRGYQLLRNRVPHAFPTRNNLDVLANILIPRWLRADSEGAHVLLMELVQHTAKELLSMTDIKHGYVIMRVKVGVDAAGHFDVWRHLRKDGLNLEYMLTTVLIPLGLQLVTGQPPFSTTDLSYIGKHVKKRFRGVMYRGNVVGVRRYATNTLVYRVEFPVDGDSEDLELNQLTPLIAELPGPIVLPKKIRRRKRNTPRKANSTAVCPPKARAKKKVKAKKKRIGSLAVQVKQTVPIVQTPVRNIAPKRRPPMTPLIQTPQLTPIKQLPVKSIWLNPRPNSPMFARPVDLIRRQESKMVIKPIVERLQNLQDIHFLVGNVVVHLDVLLFGDGKLRNMVLGEESSLCCGICQASPKLFDVAFHWSTVDAIFFVMGISPLHLLVKALESMLRLGAKMNLPSKYHVYNHPDDGKEKAMRQSIKNNLIALSPLLTIDRLQHNHVGNNGNTARDFFDPKWTKPIANILKIPTELLRRVGHLVRAMKCGHMLDTQAYRDVAEEVHSWWYDNLPKVYMPVGLHILLKHVPEYQDILGVPVGMISEEPLEHLHRVIRDTLRRHTVTSSLTAAHLSLLRYLLIRSSPTMASKYPAFQKVKRKDIPDDIKYLLAEE